MYVGRVVEGEEGGGGSNGDRGCERMDDDGGERKERIEKGPKSLAWEAGSE